MNKVSAKVEPFIKQAPPNAEAGGKPILSLKEINKWYFRGSAEERYVLRNISLDVLKGEVLVIIGPSGSGKSTLLRCMNLLTKPDTGMLNFMGLYWTPDSIPGLNPIKRRRYDNKLVELRSQIGMVFQHFNLFPHKTALQNVTVGLKRVKKMSNEEAESIAEKELSRVGLGSLVNYYPSQLSGGQKQRVAIARALAMKPQLMLFDEVTSALDPELREEILIEMKKLAVEGMTMVVVTHEIPFARDVGDRLIFMDEGTFIEEGQAEEMIANPTNQRTRDFLRMI